MVIGNYGRLEILCGDGEIGIKSIIRGYVSPGEVISGYGAKKCYVYWESYERLGDIKGGYGKVK